MLLVFQTVESGFEWSSGASMSLWRVCEIALDSSSVYMYARRSSAEVLCEEREALSADAGHRLSAQTFGTETAI